MMENLLKICSSMSTTNRRHESSEALDGPPLQEPLKTGGRLPSLPTPHSYYASFAGTDHITISLTSDWQKTNMERQRKATITE